jgi:limonene-1,2-epoxide hydrolase
MSVDEGSASGGPADPAAVVGRFVAAWEANDPEAIVSCFAEDAVWYDGYPAGRTSGTEAIRAQLERYSRHISEIAIEVVHQAVDGDVVFQERVDRGRRDGVEFEVAAVCLFRVVDGLIAENRDYWNPGAYRAPRPA